MKIKVLLVMPGKEAQKVRIPASIKFIKSLIGDDLRKIRLGENTLLIASKNSNIEEVNRFYRDSIILGTFIIVGNKRNKLVSLKRREFNRYANMFKLSKQEKKVNQYKDELLEQYYCNQRKLKQKAVKENKRRIFGIAA